MFRIFATIKRKEGVTPQAFREHYESTHAPLVCELAGAPAEYRRHYVKQPADGEPEVEFDVISEFVFNDSTEFESWIAALYAPEASEQLQADEIQFMDRANMRTYMVETCTTSKET